MKSKKTHELQPEIELLKIAVHGIDTNLSPSKKDFQEIIDNIASKKVSILFKWFWRHSDVVEFSKFIQNNINQDNLNWYVNKLIEFTSHNRPLHWLERINLFHSFGLCRLIDNTDQKKRLKTIEKVACVGRKDCQIKSLSDISAYNIALILKHADSSDSLEIFTKVNSSSLLSIYSAYQIYYYDGFENLLNFLQEYTDSPKQVIIPQTIAGLFLSEPSSVLLSKKSRERIYDDILGRMPKKVKTSLEKLDKKYEISIKS